MQGMPPTYRQVLENQSSSAFPGVFIAGALRYVETLAVPLAHYNTHETEIFALRDQYTYRDFALGEVDKITDRIRGIAQNPELRDEEEPAPPQEVVERVIALVREVDRVMGTIPPAHVSTFYGEVNVTWKAGDRIVRIAGFPDRPNLMQTGSTTMPLGSFRSELNPTVRRLADELQALFPQYDPEGQIFLG